jgi:ribonuclease Z
MGSMHEYMELAFLGTGASWPSAQRNVSALALKRGSEVLLFDCGEGTQRQFQRSELSYMAVSKIFVTHLHGDHILGLPGLLQTMTLNERDEPLQIVGPPGTKEFVSLMLSRPMPSPGFEVEVRELSDGIDLEFDGYRIEARELDHTATNLGYALVEESRPGRFDKETALDLGVPEGPAFSDLQEGASVELDDGTVVEPDQVLGPTRRGRKVAYTGDCRPCEATVRLAYHADVLVHEATFASDHDSPNEVGHSTASQAAFIAKQADARKLFLTHISPRYGSPERLEHEARDVFENVVVAEDLDTFTVTFPADEPPEVLEGP